VKSTNILFVSNPKNKVISEVEFLESKLNKNIQISESAEEAIEICKNSIPEIIVVDFDLKKMDGIEFTIELRNSKQFSNTIIAFYTDKTEDYLQIAAFNAGADDYIIKPIKLKILEHRIKALIRRIKTESIPNIDELFLGDLKINREKFQITQNGIEIILPKKEFELLSLLATKPNKVFLRNEIFKLIWAGEIEEGNRTIDVHIRKLRAKLGDNYIKTIKGVGYKLNIE
jgi:two-component system alkaline phosphatase synthesis response regulator PhoP